MTSENEHLMQRIEALAETNARLLVRLQDVTRICDAVRYTAGLGKHQQERVESAKALIKEIEAEKEARFAALSAASTDGGQ